MKTLGLCFPFLLSVLVVKASAQQQSNSPALNTDKEAIQKWLARGGQTKWQGIDSDRIMLSLDDNNASCVYMRTLSREARGS